MTKFSNSKVSRKNIFFSSVLGGAYSLITLLPNLSFIILLFAKLICCFFMIIIAFGLNNFLKNYSIFMIINFIFSGIMSMLWLFIAPVGMNWHNGIPYFHISTTTLIFSIFITYLIINLFAIITKKIPIAIDDYLVEIQIDNQKTVIKGFVDTGNFLCDIFSSTPVVVCNFKSIESILPPSIKNLLSNHNISDNLLDLPSSLISKYHIRLIPYNTIDNLQYIVAFRPDLLILYRRSQVENQSKNSEEIYNAITINDVYIGLLKGDHFLNKNYDIILNPQLIN